MDVKVLNLHQVNNCKAQSNRSDITDLKPVCDQIHDDPPINQLHRL